MVTILRLGLATATRSVLGRVVRPVRHHLEETPCLHLFFKLSKASFQWVSACWGAVWFGEQKGYFWIISIMFFGQKKSMDYYSMYSPSVYQLSMRCQR